MKRVNTRHIRNLTDHVSNAVAEKERERLEAIALHEQNVRRDAQIEFDRNPITEVPDEVKLPTDYFDEVQHRSEYNQVYAEHYYQMYLDTNLERYATAAQRVRDCHKTWIGDHYKESGYFNLKRVYHCHNRWCSLCNHLKQAKRLYEFHLLFEQLLKDYDLYHIVFTVPNVKGDILKDILNKMQSSLKKIIRYFQGFGKIAEIDFEQYGFVGAIRSFEIVINPYEYHPHLHCLFLLNKNLDFPKTEVCKYSFSHGSKVPVRLFSKLEIMLQKIFYLLINGQKVTMQNIKDTPVGYSCMMDCVEGNAWHEVFKYATKMSKDGASTCTYEQFVLLDNILRRFKMIQGYGIFYDMDKVESEADPTAEILFEKVLILLNQKEQPERDISLELEKLVTELHKKKLTVISKKLAYKYLKTIVDELRAELHIDDSSDDLPF
ncbi:MAG: protein rep [Clostridiales bacterium]|nr:protein rep [Clostridiales bacterium]